MVIVLLDKIDIKLTRITSRTLKTYLLCLPRESAPSTQQALCREMSMKLPFSIISYRYYRSLRTSANLLTK